MANVGELRDVAYGMVCTYTYTHLICVEAGTLHLLLNILQFLLLLSLTQIYCIENKSITIQCDWDKGHPVGEEERKSRML